MTGKFLKDAKCDKENTREEVGFDDLPCPKLLCPTVSEAEDKVADLVLSLIRSSPRFVHLTTSSKWHKPCFKLPIIYFDKRVRFYTSS